MLGFLNRNLSSFYCGMKIWRIGSNSLLRRLHQESTTLLNEYDVKSFEKGLHFFSATLKHECPSPGQPLSSIYMPAEVGPPIPIKVLSPSLVQFVKDAANGHEFEGNLHKAFKVLERGLVLLSDTKTELGLSQTFCDVINGIVELRKESRNEAKSNAEIAEKIFLPLIDGFIILNASHRDIKVGSDTPLYRPVIRGWEGLAMGHPSAWYGEIDMLVCNALKPDHCQIAVMSEDSRDCDSDDEDCDPTDLYRLPVPEASLAIEGKSVTSINRSFLDGKYGQGFATAITYSFVYHYGFLFKASLVPTIQVSPEGFQVFLYDCRSDLMLAQSFFWNRSSLILLWAIFHYFLFFPPTINTEDTMSQYYPFGYGYKKGGFEAAVGFQALKKDQLHFGLHRNSKKFQKKNSKLGRLIYF